MLLCKLGYTTCLVIIAFIGFYIGILVYEHYYVILAHILFYHLCSILSVSCSCRIIPYVCLSMLATWLSYHHSPGEFWLLWILMSRSWSLDRRGPSCWGPSLLLWSRQINCSSSPILAPPCWLAASPVISWAPFCTVHICTSLCILAFAPIRWCNITVIFITSGDNFVIVLICWNV